MIAGRCDGAGRAEIETAPAADLLRAGMGAEFGAEIDGARLVEGSHEAGRLGDQLLDHRRRGRVGAQIAGAQIGGGEQRRAAGQIDQDVAARDRPVARLAPDQRGARGGRGPGEAVDRRLEAAERPGRGADAPARDRHVGDGGRRDRLLAGDQHGDVERLAEAAADLDRRIVRPPDERHAAALETVHAVRIGGLGGGGEQGSHFRRGVGLLVGPARRSADVDEIEPAFEARLGGDVGKGRRLLRAADDDPVRLAERRLEQIDLAAAELIGEARPPAAARGDDSAVQGHRLLAGADEHGALRVVDRHAASGQGAGSP